MKKKNLTKEDKELIQIGKKAAIKGFIDNRKNTVGSDLAGVLKTKSGNIYTGVNMDVVHSGGYSICGERSAILHMLSKGEKEITIVVAVWISRDYDKNKKWGVLQPCGICRHVISQFGNPWIIISQNKKVRLSELYPLPIK